MKHHIADIDPLSTKEFWENYWDKHEIPKPNAKPLFHSIISNFQKGKEIEFIEIGGFPGTFAAYFAKHHSNSVSILDYFIEKGVITNTEKINELEPGTIKTIEEDLLNYKPEKKFDIVFSAGLIEHFENTEQIIAKHLLYAKPGAKLFIGLPNFRGLNGFIQKKWDHKSYITHNIRSMELQYLRNILCKFPLKNIHVDYYGKPMLWLEPNVKINAFAKSLINIVSKLLGLLPVKGRFLSPFITIEATYNP